MNSKPLTRKQAHALVRPLSSASKKWIVGEPGEAKMIYQIERIEGGIRIIYINGETACELRGGNSILIAMTFASLRNHSEVRADDYLAGVIAGLHHCILTQSIPDLGVPF